MRGEQHGDRVCGNVYGMRHHNRAFFGKEKNARGDGSACPFICADCSFAVVYARIAAFARSLFGGYYEAVREALFAQKEFLGAAVSAALTAEITVVILFLLSLAALFLSVAEPFSSSPAAERVSLHFVHFAKTLRRSYPMWLKFCRLRS